MSAHYADILDAKTALLRACAADIESGSPETAKAWVAKLEAGGFSALQHQGDPKESFRGDPLKTLEWYGGQLISMVKQDQWFGINSWLNCVDKFAPVIERSTP